MEHNEEFELSAHDKSELENPVESIEAMMPASERTRTEILDEVRSRALGREPGEDGDVTILYKLDDEEYKGLGIEWRTPESGEYWRPGVIGRVDLDPDPKSFVFDHYDLVESPDGIQLEKYSSDPSDFFRARSEHGPGAAEEVARKSDQALEEEREMGF